ncbi:hypothetical protein N7532_006433 [Penicillium argentinense]|uniref:DUF8035 domain-containing protein n=1 Tax=Penicillium argentinense TaxID=1131581 RepID=A0A9W9FFW1_9EURO|nr:uncharacterized protein N7532_006433 [Penicillium argentinense]KAJ5099432.1 hypothetical protein N7532_006433 [Penicillium argentinense]
MPSLQPPPSIPASTPAPALPQRPVPRPRFWTTPVPQRVMAHYRNLSPTGGKSQMHGGPRASTGMVQLPGVHDPYDIPRRHYDYYDDYHYPSDVGYGTHRYQPRHRSTVDVQPTGQHKYRDAGHSKKRTEYTIQPQSVQATQSRHRSRSNTTSATDLYDTPVRLAVPSGAHLRPVAPPAGRVDNLSDSGHHHLVHAQPSHHGRHRRVYSGTDYASDTGRLDPRDSGIHHRSHHGSSHRVHAPVGHHRRYPTYDGLKKGDDIDKYDAYSYTTPREQFDRDYPVKPRHSSTRSSVDRPLSLNVMEEHPQYMPRKERPHGPPPTSWGFDKLDREGRPRNSSHGLEVPRASSRTRDTSRSRGDGHDRALVAVPHDSDDGYESYDPHRRSRHRRSHRDRERYSRDDRSPRPHPHNGSGEMALAATGLGTAALGAGYSDMSDYDHRPRASHPRRSHDPERDYESTKHVPRDHTRDLNDGNDTSPERTKQMYLEPTASSHHRSGRSRRRSKRHTDSESEGYTDDDDLRKYRDEPSATPRRRHSSTDTSSGDERSARRHPRDWSRHEPSRPQQMLEDHRSHDSRGSLSGSHEDVRKPITVEPPVQKEPEVAAPKGILKPPRESFPEEPNPIREGVAPLKDANKKGIPPGARWTKIDRKLVNPEALEAGNERFEERSDYVIVLRVLSKEEVQMYAVKTQEIRGKFWFMFLGDGVFEQTLTKNITDAHEKKYIEDKRRRMEEDRRYGRRGEESSSDDEDDYEGAPLKIEAPPALEQKPSLPMRPHPSQISIPESERTRMSPSAAPA